MGSNVLCKLRAGDHDCLILYGSEAQLKLRDFSKMLSQIVLQDTGDLEYAISDILKEINKFQSNQHKTSIIDRFRSEQKKYELMIQEYNDLLVYIDKVSLGLKLQEAQLIKDNKLLEQIEKLCEECCDALEQDIQEGSDYLLQMNNQSALLEDNKEWASRLDRKIEDLKISHAVAMQSQLQVKIMIENNNQLIDKIVATISGTLPIWQNQMSVILGVQKLSRNASLQNEADQAITQSIKDSTRIVENQLRRKKVGGLIDYEGLSSVNDKLAYSLKELEELESKRASLSQELTKSIM